MNRLSLRPRYSAPDGITIYPIERLGNQLFVWAAGVAQAARLGCPSYVALGFYTQGAKRNYEYHFALDTFDHGMIEVEGDAANRPIFFGLPPLITAKLWQSPLTSRLPAISSRVFVHRGFEYDERINRIEPGTTLLGFFQSWRYFSDADDEVRRRVSDLRSPSAWFLKMSEQIKPNNGSIILNVRRSDYLLPATRAYHGVSTRAYYERALSHLRALGMTGPVYVMSEALDDVLAEFSDLTDIIPIRPLPGTDPIELILLLARCDALVMANSSFSWWGGYLGERPDRPVIAPRPWFTEASLNTKDLLLPRWLTLDREES